MLLLSLHRILLLVHSVAIRIGRHMEIDEHHFIGQGSLNKTLLIEIDAVNSAVLNLIRGFSKEPDKAKVKRLSLALKAQIEAHPTIHSDLFLYEIYSHCSLDQAELINDRDSSTYGITVVERMVDIVHWPGCNWPHISGGAESYLAERYVQNWEELQKRFADMSRRHQFGPDFPTFRSRFVHELWLGQTGGLDASFSNNLQKADKNSTLERDSLGRTSLHFKLDNAYELSQRALCDPNDCIFNDDQDSLIDTIDALGRSPLHIACADAESSGQLQNIEWLLRRNANIELRDVCGQRAIDYAIIYYRTDILHLFHEIREIQVDDILVKIQQAREATRQAMCLVSTW